MASGRDSNLAIANRAIFREAHVAYNVDQGAVPAAFPRMRTPFAKRDFQFTLIKKSGQSLPAAENDFVRAPRQVSSEKYNQHLYEFPWSYDRNELYMAQNPIEHASELASALRELSVLPSNIVLLGTNGDHGYTGGATDNLQKFTTYGIADFPHATAGTTARPNHVGGSTDANYATAGDYSTAANFVTDCTNKSILLNIKKFLGRRGLVLPRAIEPMLWALFTALWKTQEDWLAQIGGITIIPQAFTGEPSTVAGTFFEWFLDMDSIEVWGFDPIMETFRNPDNKKVTWDVRQGIMTKFLMQHDGTEYLKGVQAVNADYTD